MQINGGGGGGGGGGVQSSKVLWSMDFDQAAFLM